MPLLFVLVLIGGPLLLAILVLAARSRTRGPLDTGREWRWVRATWAASVAAGGLAAWLIAHTLDLGRGTMLIPAVLGLFVVAGVGLAETVVRPPRPPGPRTASLAPRRVVAYAPPALTIAVAATAVVHAATLALTTATASTDDLGRAGRRIASQCGDVGSAAGPYPGAFYSTPLVLLLLLTGLVAAAALRTVVRRPRGFAPDDVGDDELRRRSTTRVVAAAGTALAASQAGIGFFAGTALLRMDCHQGWMRPVGWALLASTLAALVLLGWFLGRVVAPGTRVAPAPAGVR